MIEKIENEKHDTEELTAIELIVAGLLVFACFCLFVGGYTLHIMTSAS